MRGVPTEQPAQPTPVENLLRSASLHAALWPGRRNPDPSPPDGQPDPGAVGHAAAPARAPRKRGGKT